MGDSCSEFTNSRGGLDEIVESVMKMGPTGRKWRRRLENIQREEYNVFCIIACIIPIQPWLDALQHSAYR